MESFTIKSPNKRNVAVAEDTPRLSENKQRVIEHEFPKTVIATVELLKNETRSSTTLSLLLAIRLDGQFDPEEQNPCSNEEPATLSVRAVTLAHVPFTRMQLILVITTDTAETI